MASDPTPPGRDYDMRVMALEDALRAAEINLQFAEHHQVMARWKELDRARDRLRGFIARAKTGGGE